MVKKVLEYIEERAEKEIKELLKEKEEVLLMLEKGFEKDSLVKKKEEKEVFEKEILLKIETFKQKKELEERFEIQKKKSEIMKGVYRKAIKEVSEFREEEIEKVINILIDRIPQNSEIIAGKKTASVLRKNNIASKEELNEEVFVTRKGSCEIDFRISRIIEENKEETDSEIVKILFS